MFRPEAHYETFVFEISGILLQNGSRIACGDEFRTADPECAQLVGGLLEVGLEGGKVSFGIVAKEGISSYASGSSYNALHALYGQEGAGITSPQVRLLLICSKSSCTGQPSERR